jgi:hypothetical protein
VFEIRFLDGISLGGALFVALHFFLSRLFNGVVGEHVGLSV